MRNLRPTVSRSRSSVVVPPMIFLAGFVFGMVVTIAVAGLFLPPPSDDIKSSRTIREEMRSRWNHPTAYDPDAEPPDHVTIIR